MVSSSEKWKGSYVKEKNKNKSLKKPKEVPKGNGEEGRNGEREYVGIREQKLSPSGILKDSLLKDCFPEYSPYELTGQ